MTSLQRASSASALVLPGSQSGGIWVPQPPVGPEQPEMGRRRPSAVKALRWLPLSSRQRQGLPDGFQVPPRRDLRAPSGSAPKASFPSMTLDIAKAAKLTVEETATVSARIVRWMPAVGAGREIPGSDEGAATT